MKIEAGKWYRTKEGCKAFVSGEAPGKARHGEQFVGYVLKGEEWRPSAWSEEGTYPIQSDAGFIVSEWTEKPEWCKGNPAWARWQFHDLNGLCWWSIRMPTIQGGSWVTGVGCGEIPVQNAPKLPPGCRWQDSLVEAPEGWGKDVE